MNGAIMGINLANMEEFFSGALMEILISVKLLWNFVEITQLHESSSWVFERHMVKVIFKLIKVQKLNISTYK